MSEMPAVRRFSPSLPRPEAMPVAERATVVAPAPSTHPSAVARVAIVDLDMPMTSMVWFIFKWTVAAIPALLMLVIIAFAIGMSLGGLRFLLEWLSTLVG